MSAAGFAVIDVETTGPFSHAGDRMIELAIVHVDADGAVTDSWDTLVEPHRALGSQHVHGLTADDMVGAPTFEQIAPRLIELLDGRTIVAHNAAFHVGFLLAELEAAGYPVTVIDPLCTMQLARQFLPGAGRTLEDCCDAYDIEFGEQRRASADALATAHLLGAYLQSARFSPVWRAAAPVELSPIDGPDVSWLPRRENSARAASFLQRITVKLPEFSGPADQLDYLALLDRCLLDRELSTQEANQLVALAEILGISRPTVVELHLQYFEELASIAWADDVLTEDEVQDLVTVGALLSIPTELVERAMEPLHLEPVGATELTPGRFALQPGDHVVLAGALEHEWVDEVNTHGLVLSDAVTKHTRVVVTADPTLISGKLRKAADYGVPVMAESAFAKLLQG